MANALTFAQHLSALEPEKDQARHCLYNFLKNLCHPQEPLSDELFERFIKLAIHHEFWQRNFQILLTETRALLDHFYESNSQERQDFPILQPDDQQIVKLESFKSFEAIVQRYIDKRLQIGERCRLVPFDAGSMVAIVQDTSKQLRVTNYHPVAIIKNGRLIPATDQWSLYYSADLNFRPDIVQTIDIGNNASAYFSLTGDGIYGVMTRGYSLQKVAPLEGGGLHRYPALFYPIKRLEQTFINRDSDPMYLELVTVLEKAVELIQEQANKPTDDTVKFAFAAVDRGKLALQYIFPDDRIVKTLISQLETLISVTTSLTNGTQMRQTDDAWEKASLDSTNTWQNAE